jgi:hypothetical protein
MNAKKAKLLKKWSGILAPYHSFYLNNKKYYNALSLIEREKMSEEMRAKVKMADMGIQEVLPAKV